MAYAAGFVGLEGRHAWNGPTSVPVEGFGTLLRCGRALIFARQTPHPPTLAKKLAQHAINRPLWATFPALGEYFRAVVIDRPRRANFVAPMRSTAPQHVTVSTNAGTSRHRYETHDAFAR